jgi:protein SCO1/2
VRSFIFVLTLCFLLIAPLAAENDQPKPPVGIVEKLGNMLPLDTEFYDEDGHLVSLKSIITKPTVFTFVYYKCPGICSPLLTEVTKVVSKMDLEPGVDYQLVTISFDHEEKPDLAKEKQENYIAEVERPMPAGSWRFFTGDSSAIASLTDAAGFYFARDGRDWIHAGVLIIASPQGKVTRYLFGIKHLPFDVKMAVMEASEGKTGPTIAKVLSFCFTYDPEGKRYAFDVVRVSGVVIVAFVAVFAIVFLRRKRK